jgi:hypothetical protein
LVFFFATEHDQDPVGCGALPEDVVVSLAVLVSLSHKFFFDFLSEEREEAEENSMR